MEMWFVLGGWERIDHHKLVQELWQIIKQVKKKMAEITSGKFKCWKN